MQPTWQSRKIGEHRITITQYAVLRRMAEAVDDDGYMWLLLDDVHQATLKLLITRDWIVGSGSKHAGFNHYKITSRGAKIYRQASVPTEKRHRDGTCPRCEQRQRGWYSTGTRRPYCAKCDAEQGRRAYQVQGVQKDPDALCPACGERKRYQTKSGFIHSYCIECKRAKHRAYKRRKHAKIRKRVESGEVILCRKCNANPIYITTNSVYDVCYSCQRDYMNRYNKRRRDYRYEDGAS